QFNQFRLREEPSEDFIRLLDDVFGALFSAGAKSDLLTAKDNLPALFLLVSSDEGFLGELNFLLVNRLLSSRRPQDNIICVGAQGVNYLREIQVGFSSLDSPGEKLDSQRIAAVRDYILSEYLKRNVGKVYVVYSRFINITVQQVELEVLLPIPEARSPAKPVKNLLIEPDIDSVIEGWMKAWLDFRLYQIFWSSKLAEFAARIMHLEGSVQELNKINNHLRMEYFKYLHGLSDKSIRELTAARLIGKER
ncbi:MAG: FoF1 ATP synthase subunit gamma, partial [Candidatus Omnitrophota bacterium]|nr:FoF1 ATP synthase subunit gamma [Candidatus Omnitrophota bacterium]